MENGGPVVVSLFGRRNVDNKYLPFGLIMNSPILSTYCSRSDGSIATNDPRSHTPSNNNVLLASPLITSREISKKSPVIKVRDSPLRFVYPFIVSGSLKSSPSLACSCINSSTAFGTASIPTTSDITRLRAKYTISTVLPQSGTNIRPPPPIIPSIKYSSQYFCNEACTSVLCHCVRPVLQRSSQRCNRLLLGSLSDSKVVPISRLVVVDSEDNFFALLLDE